jgi:hypothetical protein
MLVLWQSIALRCSEAYSGVARTFPRSQHRLHGFFSPTARNFFTTSFVATEASYRQSTHRIYLLCLPEVHVDCPPEVLCSLVQAHGHK